MEFGISGLNRSSERNDGDGEVEAWARSRVYTVLAATTLQSWCLATEKVEAEGKCFGNFLLIA